MKSRPSLIRDVLLATVVIISIYIVVLFFWERLLQYLIRIPAVEQLYRLGIEEVQKKSIIGLWLMTFAGSLFFVVVVPSEILFVVYVRAGNSILSISAIMLLSSMLGQFVNYGFGYFIKKKMLHEYVRHGKRHFVDHLKKYDAAFIIILNIMPVPSDILSLFLGIIRYNFRRFVILTLLGRFLKLAFLIILYFVIQWFGYMV